GWANGGAAGESTPTAIQRLVGRRPQNSANIAHRLDSILFLKTDGRVTCERSRVSSMIDLLSKWPLVRQIRERKDGTGLESMSEKTLAMHARSNTEKTPAPSALIAASVAASWFTTRTAS